MQLILTAEERRRTAERRGGSLSLRPLRETLRPLRETLRPLRLSLKKSTWTTWLLTQGASAKPIGRLNQRAQVAGFHDRVSGVRGDVQFGFRPGAMQVPRAIDRTDNILPPLHNHSANFSNLP